MANNASNEVAVKCGYMLIKRPHSDAKQFRIKAWQTKYFVLKGDHLNNNCRLEYFKNESACSSPKAEKNCISLHNVEIFIDEYISRSQDHSFILCVKGQYPLVLACESGQLKSEWIAALKGVALKCTEPQDAAPLSPSFFPNGSMSPTVVSSRTPELEGSPLMENNSTGAISEYHVSTRLTPSSEHNDIRGEYVMRLTSDTIVLMSLDKSHEAVSWPIVYVRKFKSEATESTDLTRRQLLTLEISSKSPRGQGIFQFHTESGNKITALIRAAARRFVDTHHRREVLTRMNTWSEKKVESIQSDESNSTAKRRNTVTGGKKVHTKPGTNPENDNVPLQEGDPCGMHAICEWSSQEDSEEWLDTLPSPTNGETSASSKLQDRSQILENVNKLGEMDENKVSRTTERNMEAVEDDVETNSYIDVLADEHATPIHISDKRPDDSTHESTWNDGCLLATNASAPQGNASTGGIPLECGNTVSGVYELQTRCDNKDCDITDGSKETSISAVENSGGGEISKLPVATTDAATRRLYNDLVAQISNPTEYPQSVFPSRPHAEYENVQKVKLKAKQLSEEEEAQEEEKRKDLNKKLSENPKLLLEDVLNQLATPQKHNARDVFPYLGHRNSIGELSTERVQQESVSSQPEKNHDHESPKKVLGKSKSDMGTASFQTNPPPVPLRPEISRGFGRRSEGDILDNIARNSTFSTSRNPTQVGKGIRKSSQLGIGQRLPLALAANRFDMNTMTLQSDVSARRSKGETPGKPLRALKTFEASESLFTAEITKHKTERRKSEAETTKPRSNSTVFQSKIASERADEESEKKRKVPRPSKIAKKIWKNVSSPPSSPLSNSLRKFTKRRESSCSCGEEERAEVDRTLEQPRRQSLTPLSTTAIGRVSGSFSEHSTPDTSPKLERKRENSKEHTHVFINKSSFDDSHHVAVSYIVESMEAEAEPAPVIPPRKKEEPPPLPPRKAKPSSQGSSCSGCSHNSCTHGNGLHGDDSFLGNSKQKNKKHYGADKSKVFVPSTRRRSSGEKNILGLYDDSLPPPPPVPPRREGSRSPSPAPHLPYKHSTPLIQLTWSSTSSEPEQQESDSKHKEEHFETRPHSTSDASYKSDVDRSRSSSEVSQPRESERSRSGSEEYQQSDMESESCPTSPSYPSSQNAAPPRPPRSARGLKASEFFHTRQEEFVFSDTSDVELELADSQRHTADSDSSLGLTAEAPKSPKYRNMVGSAEDLTEDFTDPPLSVGNTEERYASTAKEKPDSHGQLSPRCSEDSGRASPGRTSPLSLKMTSQVLTLSGAGETNAPLRV